MTLRKSAKDGPRRVRRTKLADEADCAEWQKAIEKRLADARTRFDSLAGSRTGTQTLRDAAASLLTQWFLHGRR